MIRRMYISVKQKDKKKRKRKKFKKPDIKNQIAVKIDSKTTIYVDNKRKIKQAVKLYTEHLNRK